ncbi:hypothetical protein N7539_006091 [Penicillium diatomitis]|uniref:Uncharacterized protein n=1 Tax=Penicillium diatomitis TaxID=2819901 RepID=A0A9W9WT09_9EURO|nr:uncharacterized protein N7539_008028 [Penicillium diatomitis]XP_056789161.1 uncharacterized protein N7539_006091 [Penicillium diatomitis]KAJ5474962.1 hypothetical protein N7539_008028 [Penicillium diatomitis]KAJ5483891.1 hypothetical protein N7539_006091 [Penicillium diatomitis]
MYATVVAITATGAQMLSIWPPNGEEPQSEDQAKFWSRVIQISASEKTTQYLACSGVESLQASEEAYM